MKKKKFRKYYGKCRVCGLDYSVKSYIDQDCVCDLCATQTYYGALLNLSFALNSLIDVIKKEIKKGFKKCLALIY